MLIEKCIIVRNLSIAAVGVSEAGTQLTVVIVSGEAARILSAYLCGYHIRIRLAHLIHSLR